MTNTNALRVYIPSSNVESSLARNVLRQVEGTGLPERAAVVAQDDAGRELNDG
jgi:hypothetical protein